MPWLLDTNICIYIIKQKPISVFEKFSAISPGEIALFVITLAELEYGARKSVAVEKNLAALENKGTPIGSLDMLMAAHAKSLNYVLVTNNEKEFSRVSGLQVENWV